MWYNTEKYGNRKEHIMKLKTALLSLILSLSIALIPAFAAGTYIHDPMANPKAAQDIVADPSAVYGYRPSPDSVRLKEYAGYDWTDPAFVAQQREKRLAYHENFAELYQMIDSMKAAGRSVEEIARAVSTRRNELRLEAYKDDPEGLEKTKKSNLETFGDENGGSPDYFYAKYGSWETVIEKALSVNPGADAILGLYDMFYDTYFITPQDSYTVRPGDSLYRIAGRELGDPGAWRRIYDLNRDHIANPDLIYPGQVLKLRAS